MQVNGVFFDKIRSFEQFKELIGNLNTQGGNFIIKLNWVESSKGQYTELRPLQGLFDCLEGRKIIVESHTAWRNKVLLETGKMIVNEKNIDEKNNF